jgi:ParB family chromosome partitioning protein
MLGKGLESLIPPQRDQNNAAAQPASQSSSQPQSQPQQPQTQPQSHAPFQPQSQPQQPSRPIEPGKTGEAAKPASGGADQLPQIASPQPSASQSAPAQSQPSFFAKVEKVFSQSQAAVRKDDQIIGSIYQIEVDRIYPNPNQPRRDFNQDSIRDMANSIREFGILQPLVVTKIEKETPSGIDVEYQLIAGERRLLASKLLGLRLVPAIIRNVSLEREKLELAIIENIQRENLNPIEAARAFQRLQEEFKLTQREIASKLGKSRETVANSVRLLDLPPYIQEALQKGDISESHGRLLLAIDDPGVQRKLFDDISLYRLTTRDVKDRVERLKRPTVGETEGENLPPEIRAMKDSLSQSLGAPVEIKKGVNTGRISITFYSQEELENILRRLGNEGM